MISIDDFIAARLDDDELRIGPYPVYACPPGTVLYTIKQREHRDIDAKRKIVELHGDQHECATTDGAAWPYVGCTTLRLLAMRWDDHEDWRAEWAVE